MQANNQLFVFTSLRRIRQFHKLYENTFIPKAISIDEFFNRAVFVKGLSYPSDAELLLCMQSACIQTKDAIKELAIPIEFFAFLKNYNYLFSFFKEIAHQKKSIDELKFKDIYANYDEHLEILSSVLHNYKNILKQNGFYDDITICELYNINERYIKSYSEISIEIFGILSEFEWEILLKCSKLTKINIIFNSSKLNKKLIDKIISISAKSIDEIAMYHKFSLNLNDFSLINLGQNRQNKLVLLRGFSLRSMQVAYVFEKISTFIKDGISAENIAVILPDESFATTLRLYDDKKMLSFAMGKPFSDTIFYVVLDLIMNSLKEQKDIVLDKTLFDSLSFKSDELLLNLLNITQDTYNSFKFMYNQIINYDEFNRLLSEFCSLFDDKNVFDILQTELFCIRLLLEQRKLKFYQAIELLLIRLRDTSLDDVGGGAVRVMGLLESRGLKFDGVIIVDFNDDLVPKRVVNEMFISSKVRQKAGLISYTQRENLQRSYYESLINNAKKVAISYSTDDDKIVSRFLSEFDVVKDVCYSDDDYLGIFRSGRSVKFREDKEFVRDNFFGKPLSFSRLNTFLKCPRKYYYHYVLQLKQAPLLTKPNSEYGTQIHNALFEYYQNQKEFILPLFLDILKTKKLNSLEFEICAIKFKEFQKFENSRIAEGWSIFELECKKSAVVNGVDIEGIIDRIDRRFDELCVIDYKTGSSNDPLQLEFYKYLANANEAHFYDLKDTMAFLPCKDPKISLIDALEYTKHYFMGDPKFDSRISNDCSYCQFFAICRGEIC